MTGGILYEHSHRLLATCIALISFVLAVVATLTRPRGDRVRRAAYLALGLVLVQALLGGITVLMRLPPLVSIAHLAVGMLFFTILIWISSVLRQESVGRAPSKSQPSAVCSTLMQRWPLFATVLCYVQIVLGAAVRHSGAALACPEFPGCGSDFWPGLSNMLGQIQMAHRTVGILLATLVVAGMISLERTRTHEPRTLMAARTAVGLILLQVFLGFASVSSSLDVVTVSLHLGTAALLLANLLTLHRLFVFYRDFKYPPRSAFCSGLSPRSRYES